MNNYILPITTFLLGWFLHFSATLILERVRKKNSSELIENYFSEVLSLLENEETQFLSRVNNLITLSTKMKDFGDVKITYTIDTKEVNVFKDQLQILTSKEIDLKSVIRLTSLIEKTYGKKIEDSIEVLGTIYNRENFEKSVSELSKLLINQVKTNTTEESPEQDPVLTIDDILDKINRVGFDNLTDQEKEFLKKHK